MRKLAAASAALGLVAAACGGAGTGTAATTPETLPDQPATITSVGDTPSRSGVAAGWEALPIAPGIKPVLALDSSGQPAIAYLIEATDGHIGFASQATGWTAENVVDGYFYGPIGLAFDLADRPFIAYHDHQDLRFDQNLGDLTLGVRDGGDWTITALSDDGHDGWDSTIAIGPDGVVRAAGVDPQQFGSTEGVEYYELRNGDPEITAIGSGPIEYEWNVSLAVDPEGRPGLSWFNNNTQNLQFALLDGVSWQIETVASDGDIGRFSSLAFDNEGRPHLSFVDYDGARGARVLYAVKEGSDWSIEQVGQLTEVFLDFAGARRITSLALDTSGIPRIAFSDQAGIHYGVRDDTGWSTDRVVASPDLQLGQLVSLAIDESTTPHIAYFEPEGDGTVFYLTRT